MATSRSRQASRLFTQCFSTNVFTIFETMSPATSIATIPLLVAGAVVYSRTDQYRNKSVQKIMQSPLNDPVRLISANSYVPISGLVNPLKEAMLASRGAGIYVMCLPTGGGKSTAACRTANSLVNANMLNGSLYVDVAGPARTETRGAGHDVLRALDKAVFSNDGLPTDDQKNPLLSFLCRALEVRHISGCFQRISDTDERQTTLILDNVDAFLEGNDSCRSCVRHLATESVRTKDFNVVMLCKSPLTAEQVWSYNGQKKIHLVHPDGLMDGETADEIIRRYHDVYPFKNADVREYFVKQATICGAPGFIATYANAARKMISIDEAKHVMESAVRVHREQQSELNAYQELWKQDRCYDV